MIVFSPDLGMDVAVVNFVVFLSCRGTVNAIRSRRRCNAVRQSETDERETITDDVQSSRCRDGSRRVDKCDTLQSLSVLVGAGDERRRRQTTDDVEPTKTSPARHRYVATERELHNCATNNSTAHFRQRVSIWLQNRIFRIFTTDIE